MVEVKINGGWDNIPQKDFLEDIARVVLEEKADIGFGFDGDGDRIGVVDEKGGIMWNDECFKIKWPIENLIISEKDSSYMAFKE